MTSALFTLSNITCDTSAIESDGSRWYGPVLFVRNATVVRGTWIGAPGSDMGEIVDVEGEDEALCEAVDALAGVFESKVTDLLGNPRVAA